MPSVGFKLLCGVCTSAVRTRESAFENVLEELEIFCTVALSCPMLLSRKYSAGSRHMNKYAILQTVI